MKELLKFIGFIYCAIAIVIAHYLEIKNGTWFGLIGHTDRNDPSYQENLFTGFLWPYHLYVYFNKDNDSFYKGLNNNMNKDEWESVPNDCTKYSGDSTLNLYCLFAKQQNKPIGKVLVSYMMFNSKKIAEKCSIAPSHKFMDGYKHIQKDNDIAELIQFYERETVTLHYYGFQVGIYDTDNNVVNSFCSNVTNDYALRDLWGI